ncbi:YtxH domain-containing protein [Streptomyces sp. NBC_00370]|uniref:YtxH domain-containing protein n=1 Tax=Streptomyces sp. NBC_00370 TaxID=2975728 RepID=UPI002E26A45C
MRYRLTFIAGLAFGYVLGTRAGRERYEKLKKSARQVSQNPAVRNAAESAAQTGREFAGKAYHSVSDKVGDKVGDRVPASVAQRVRSLRDRSHSNGQDDWGTSAT